MTRLPVARSSSLSCTERRPKGGTRDATIGIASGNKQPQIAYACRPRLMSALGQKQAWAARGHMSGSPLKADIPNAVWNVRYGQKPTSVGASVHVR